MKTIRRVLLPITLSISLAIIITSCGGGNKQEGESPRLMPTEHGSMSEGHGRENSSEDMHNLHNNLADNFSHEDIVILGQPYQPSEATKNELEKVIVAYLQVKDALVKDDEVGVNKSTGVMAEKVSSVIPTQLKGKGFEAWQNHKTLYEAKLKEMRHITGLENKRSYFNHISEIMYCTIKSFGLKQGDLFAVFCPMAFNNKGAYWISDSKTIQNPYMGAKMPTCGEIKEEL